jgi:N-acetylglucosaminyldiphosphoundecaprenol N-acetyl-beta-D-mannosaminyltransferase
VRTVNILNVEVSCVDLKGLLETVYNWTLDRERHTIAYVNAHCLNSAYIDRAYREILGWADLILADGIGVVWSSRLLGGCRLQKLVAGAWIDEFCEMAGERNISIYILAGKPGIAERAADNLKMKWPKLHISGTCDGYFSDKSEAELLTELAYTKPDVVFVGMGTPRQEKWLYDHRNEIRSPVCWAVGALFDYIAGIERRVPGWMYNLGLEWLWRLLVDPAGKWRRYVIGNPLFVYRVIRQKVGF